MAQSADKNEVNYAQLLQEIANMKLTIIQKEAYVATQKAKIASLQSQIKGTDELKKSVNPMFDKMAAAIEIEIQKDIPFKAGERLQRLDKLKTDIADADRSPGDKMRSALLIYDIEVGYGQSIEAYAGNHPTSPGARYVACEADTKSKACSLSKAVVENMAAGATLRDLRNDILDGNYLRYGRLALAYQNIDGTDTMRYDPTTKEWVALSSGQALEVERGLRAARGEAAPTVVNAPVYVTN